MEGGQYRWGIQNLPGVAFPLCKGIRLRFNLDDNNNAAANYLSLHSGDAGAANRPKLIIEYYVP